MTATVDTCSVTESVSDALRRAVGDDRNALKKVAQAAGVGIGTAKNWLDGRNAPTLAKFGLLCRRFPEMKRVALDLCDMQQTRDPEFDKAFTMAMQAWSAAADRSTGET